MAKTYVTISFVLDAKLKREPLLPSECYLEFILGEHSRVCSQHCQLPLKKLSMPNECTKVERWKALPVVFL